MLSRFVILMSVILGISTAVTARFRGRSPQKWFFIGLFFGWLGLLLLYILPSKVLGEEIKVPPIPSETPVEKLEQSERGGEWFFLDREKNVCGPVTDRILKDKWKEGQLSSESWVWNESIVDWKQISRVQSLLDWLQRM